MAVAATNLTTSGNNVDQTTYATASITPTANNLVLAWVYSIASAAPNIPTASGNGLTWVAVDSQIDFGNLRRITLFRAMGTSPTAGAVTFSFGGQTQVGGAWSVVQYSGTDTTGTNGSGAIVQAVKAATAANATSQTITLAAFASVNNATAGGFGIPLNTAALPAVGTGFTATGQRNQATPNLSIGTEFNAGNDTTVDMTSSTSSVPWCGIAVEIKASTVSTPLMGTLQDYFNQATLNSTLWNQFTGGGATMSYDSTGATVIYPASATASTDGDITSKTTYDLTGSAAYMQVLAVPTGGTNPNAEMRLYADSNNWVRMVYDGGLLYAQQRVAGTNTTIASMAYNATNHKYWRISVSGTTIFWEVSADGTTYNQLNGSAQNTTPITITALTVLIAGTCYKAESNPGTFKWNNFNIMPVSGTTGQMKVWNGTAWVAKPVKVWNGTAWVAKPVKVWNGTAWVATTY